MLLKHIKTGVSFTVFIHQQIAMHGNHIINGYLIGFGDKEIAKSFGFYSSYGRDYLYRGFNDETLRYVHPLLEVRDKGFSPAPGSVLDSYHLFNWVVLPTDNFRLTQVESNSEGLSMLPIEEG